MLNVLIMIACNRQFYTAQILSAHHDQEHGVADGKRAKTTLAYYAQNVLTEHVLWRALKIPGVRPVVHVGPAEGWTDAGRHFRLDFEP